MFQRKADQPKPQFVMHFEPKHYSDFEQVTMWLIGQTGLDGWRFESRELRSDAPVINKLMSSLRIEDESLAFQAKLTFPEILLNYGDLEHKLGALFFFDPKKYRRIDNKNYDIIPVNNANN